VCDNGVRDGGKRINAKHSKSRELFILLAVPMPSDALSV